MEFCQLQLNYMDWHFQKAKEKVELIQAAGLPVWVMEPLRGGRLAKASEGMKEELQKMRPVSYTHLYELKRWRAVDMFPHTGHVETAVLLVRKP